MKNLFKKYYHSILRPDEFSEFTDFMRDKKNESIIFSLMKPLWRKEIEKTDLSMKTNPALYTRIQEAISQDKQKIASRKINIYSWGLRIAAVLVVALLVSNIIFFKKFTENQFTGTVQNITIPYGAKTRMTLPDGSLVWINSGSTLSYSTQFKENRPVTLVGEAYFEVKKNDKPFIVSTQYGDVEVKGTSFNVKAYIEDNSFEATLEEGVVDFKVKDSDNRVTLKPGEQIVKTTKGFTIKQVETKYFTSWKNGKLLFHREPFPSFIKKLERWYNVKIEYSDSELDQLRYTGTIEMESISEVMEMVSRAAPVSYNFNNTTRIFTIKAK